MLAARYYAKHKLVVEDVPTPEPGKGQVQIRIRYCGICGTDAHIFEGDKGSMEVVPPRILGHEFRASSAGWARGLILFAKATGSRRM